MARKMGWFRYSRTVKRATRIGRKPSFAAKRRAYRRYRKGWF